MKIQFLGHASFLLTTSADTRIVTDPFDPEKSKGALKYRPFKESADIVTLSHDHFDHGAANILTGNPILIRGNGKFVAREVEFLGVETYHDESHGGERGRNTVFVISVDGLRIAHMGDLGHILNADQAAEIGSVDVVLIPVGGYYTIDASQAAKIANQIAAKIVIPMHYKNDKCDFPIASVDEFLKDKSNVTYQGDSVIEVTKENLPPKQQIIVLDYAL